MTRALLVLAGTAEARVLLRALAEAGPGAAPGYAVTASLAGVTAAPVPYGVPTRTGGFGGAAGLARHLERHRVAALIDATHPFAARMAAAAAQAAAATGTPRLKLLRPGWPMAPGWRAVPSLEAAADALPPGARVLLATGGSDIAAFAARPDLACHLRLITPRGDLPPHIAVLTTPPGADPAEEAALFARLGLTHLVTRDSGGPTGAKLAAASTLGLGVIVVQRPAAPPGPVATDVAGALAWLAALPPPSA